jgi:hypothetical protein
MGIAHAIWPSHCVTFTKYGVVFPAGDSTVCSRDIDRSVGFSG